MSKWPQNGCMASLDTGNLSLTDNDVQLCDAASVAKLLATEAERRPRARRDLRGDQLAKARPQTARPRRCTCGICPFCVENERWDRIFKQRFEDLTYYRRPLIGHSSSLSSMI
jgi:hypothetical protein